MTRPPKYKSRKKTAPAIEPSYRRCAGPCAQLVLTGDLRQNLCKDCYWEPDEPVKIGYSKTPVRTQAWFDKTRAMRRGE